MSNFPLGALGPTQNKGRQRVRRERRREEEENKKDWPRKIDRGRLTEEDLGLIVLRALLLTIFSTYSYVILCVMFFYFFYHCYWSILLKFKRTRTLCLIILLLLMVVNLKGASKNEPSHTGFAIIFMCCLGSVGLEGSSLPFHCLLLCCCDFFWRK